MKKKIVLIELVFIAIMLIVGFLEFSICKGWMEYKFESDIRCLFRIENSEEGFLEDLNGYIGGYYSDENDNLAIRVVYYQGSVDSSSSVITDTEDMVALLGFYDDNGSFTTINLRDYLSRTELRRMFTGCNYSVNTIWGYQGQDGKFVPTRISIKGDKGEETINLEPLKTNEEVALTFDKDDDYKPTLIIWEGNQKLTAGENTICKDTYVYLDDEKIIGLTMGTDIRKMTLDSDEFKGIILESIIIFQIVALIIMSSHYWIIKNKKALGY